MDLVTLFRIIVRNLKWLIALPILTGVLVLFLTKDLPSTYTTDTVIYTGLASGFDITSGSNSKVDYFSVNNAFDNLITTIESRETIEEVSLKLLTQHLMLDEPVGDVLQRDGFQHLKETVSDSLRAEVLVPERFDSTFLNLYTIYHGSVNNDIASILSSSSSFYGVDKIKEKMRVTRVNNSDMIKISYNSSDPGVAQHTLLFLANTFTQRYRGLKGLETENVVKYFEDQVQLAFQKLRSSEENLKDFGIENRIINYYEQTEFIAQSKEDLRNEIYEQRMKKQAAEASLERLESKLSSRLGIIKNNTDLVEKRQELARINLLLSNAEVYKSTDNKVDSLMKESYKIQDDLKSLADAYMANEYSIEGIPSENLLSEWLQKIIELEEANAYLKVYQERKQEFEDIYTEFAPLGSMLSKLEREVDINEKQYLTVLNGLNTAKLREQNISMSNNLSVLDDPYFPLEPESSKTSLLVVVAAMAVGFIILGILLARELLDSSIQSTVRAEKSTGLSLFGALPLIDKQISKKVEIDSISDALLEQMISVSKLDLRNAQELNETSLIVFFSNLPNEGKSYAAREYAKKLTQINGHVLLLEPERFSVGTERETIDIDNLTICQYPVTQKFVETSMWRDLVDNQDLSPDARDSHYVIVVLPPLNKQSMPSRIVQNSHLNIFVLDSTRNWTSSDQHLLNLFLSAAYNQTRVLLNKVSIDNLEGLLGEIPKKRSWLRKKGKQILSLNFK